MNKTIGWLMAMFIAFAAQGVRADGAAPDALIRQTADEVLAVVQHDKALRGGDQAKLLKFVEAKILPHFDFERMTQLAVGRPWRSATADQRQQLVTQFRTLLVRTYTSAFTRYDNQKVVIDGVTPNEKRPDESTVNTRIVKPGTQAISVNYVMEKKEDGWKVFDLYIDGASLIESYKGSFTEKAHQEGIDGLIKFLSDKNQANVGKPLGKAQTK